MVTRAKYLLWLLIAIYTIGNVAAQQNAERSLSPQSEKSFGYAKTDIQFRWDRSNLDTTYLNNQVALQKLNQQINSLGTDAIDSLVILLHASPEGTRRHNERLVARRAATMQSYIQQNYPALADRMHISPNGESWSQLRSRIAEDKRLSNRSKERLLAIIDDPNTSIDQKKRSIQHDPARRYLYATHYPHIRNSMICLVYFHGIKQIEPLELVYEPKPLQHKTLTTLSQRPTPQIKDTLTFALKTNLLYDLLTAINVEVEVPIGKRWSVAAEYLCPWWEKDNKYCLQIQELGFEGRYWFREQQPHANCLQGWFVGPYVMSGRYDLQYKDELNYQGEFYSAGLSAGYATPISKRLNLEFSLSVGYFSTGYRHYFPADDYSQLFKDGKQGRTSYVGPTKLKVSLVYPLHILHKKGGRR